jgi:amino acid adenylation domain-containing protein
MRSLGVSPDDRVAIYALSSIEYSVAMLGVLKSGGCYVPIDVSYPPARVQHILASSGCRFVLCDPEHLDRFDAAQIKVLPLDQLKIEASGFSSEPLTEKPSGTSLCYVIYTSGSTGQPKGVAIPHRAAANHMTWMQREYALTETDRVLQRTPIGFDASIWEFHAPLTSGATLVVPESDVNRDPASLIRAIKSNAITVLQVVPALLQSLVALNEFATIRCLRRVFCGGEQLAPELVRRFHGDLDAGLINLYGPTEATIDSTSYNTKNEDPVPIGRPIDNVATYVLDPELRRVPYGALGELYIGGGGLARGYLNASAMTAEVFLPDPYATEKGSRMYRTGDLVRRRNDGQLEWLGRLDRQVKLRGYRLELGEIENVLLGCDHVAECSVLVQSTGQFDARLIAFVVPVDSHTLVVQVLRDCLLQLLPPYMVPGRMFLLECLPRTEHGKIDKMRLAEIARTRPTLESSYVHSRNSEEGVIAAIWARALEVDAVGIDDNFFELGGSSLTILRVHELISEQWPGRVSLMDLFRYTTVRSQAGRLSELSMPQNTINEEFDRGSRRRMAARRSRPLEEK